jgi:hypothetical protein
VFFADRALAESFCTYGAEWFWLLSVWLLAGWAVRYQLRRIRDALNSGGRTVNDPGARFGKVSDPCLLQRRVELSCPPRFVPLHRDCGHTADMALFV